MGRNSKKKWTGFNGAESHSKGQRPYKKQKGGRFWVEDCKETTMPRTDSSDKNETETASDVPILSLEVLITRSDLVDDYRQVARPSEDTSNPTDESNKSDVVEALKNPIKTSLNGDNANFETDNHSAGIEIIVSDSSEEQGKENDKSAIHTVDSTKTISPNDAAITEIKTSLDGDNATNETDNHSAGTEIVVSNSSEEQGKENDKSTIHTVDSMKMISPNDPAITEIKMSLDGDNANYETDNNSAGTEIVVSNSSEEQGKENDKSAIHTVHSTKMISPNDAAITEAITKNVEASTSTVNVDNAFICVRRSRSAKKPMQVTGDSVENFRPLPNGDCGDGIINPHPKDEVPDKFWSQRRRLFTRFDDGIQLDKESWFSVTPEAIAKQIAAHLVTNRENVTILDPFCGCGGNAIAFAQRPEVNLVVCVDHDVEKLKMAAFNAAIYNIPPEKMVFIHRNGCTVLSSYENGNLMASLQKQGDESNGARPMNQTEERTHGPLYTIGGTDLLPTVIDCVFLSPPWGGMDYGKVGKRNYTLACINVQGEEEDSCGIDGAAILLRAAKALGTQSPLAFYLPRNINGISLGKSALQAGYKGPVVLEQNVLNGKLKTVTAYFGL